MSECDCNHEHNPSWVQRHQDEVSSVMTFAVFAAGLAWIMGVFHVALDYPERYAIALIALGSTAFAVTDGVEVAVKRVMGGPPVHVTELDISGPDETPTPN